MGTHSAAGISGIRTDRCKQSATKKRVLRHQLTSAIRPIVENLETRCLLSYSPAGTLDGSFNATGKAITDLGGQDQGNGVAVLSNGDIVVAGSSNGQFAVALYSSTGSFLNSAITSINGSSQSQANAVTVQSNGGIIAAGYAADGATNDDFVVARFIVSGNTISLDQTGDFNGTTGYAVTDIDHASKADIANAVTISNTTGDIIVAGQTGTGGTEHAVIAAYTTAGALDSTFDSANATQPGVLVATGGADEANDLVVTSTGTIAVAGQASTGPELLLVTSNGSSLARHSVTLGGSATATAVAIAQNGEYLLAGTADQSFVLAELTSAGALDTSFGSGTGKVETSFANSTFADAEQIAVQSNGKIVLAGYETDESGFQFFALSRYNTNGTADTAFGSAGTVTTDFSGNATADSVANGVAIEADGKIIAAGYTGAGTNPDNFAVARYVANNAPVASGNATFDTIDENDDATPGNTVTQLVSRFGFTDPDGDTIGIAITAVTNTHGTWQYSTNGGTSWSAITVSAATSALLLSNSSSNVVRFQPSSGYTGSSSMTVAAWDQTQYANTSIEDTTSTGASQTQNLNTFSTNTVTASISVGTNPTIVHVNSTWAGSGQGATVTDSEGGTYTYGINAFSTIQNGVSYVASGGTVDVDGGASGSPLTYTEAVTISQSLTLDGYGAGQLPTVTAPSTSSDVAVISVAAANVTVENMDVIVDQPHAAAGIAAVSAATGANIFNGLQVLDNTITSEGTGGALSTAFGSTYTVGIAAVANPSGAAPTVTIQGNQILTGTGGPTLPSPYTSLSGISAFSRGIWLNQAEGTIGGATSAQGNNVYGSTEDVEIQELRGPTTISYNTLNGAGMTIGGLNANAPTTISHNTFSTNATFVSLEEAEGIQPSLLLIEADESASSPLTVNANNYTLQTGTIGVWSTASEGVAVGDGLAGDGNTFTAAAGATGFTYVAADTKYPTVSDAETTGVSNSISIQGNSFGAGSGTAISIADHNSGVATPDYSSIIIGGSGAAANTFLTGLSEFISLLPSSSTAPSGPSRPAADVSNDIDATQNNFGVSSGDTQANYTLADYYEIEDKILDGIDYAGAGLVRIKESNLYVAQDSDLTADGGSPGSIQRAINLANSGDTVNVQAGTFIGDVVVSTSLTLSGAQAGQNAVTRFGNFTGGPDDPKPSDTVESIITPASADGNGVIIDVDANAVTIDGFVLDGNNPNLGAGAGSVNGVAYDAGFGVGNFDPTITPNIVKQLTVKNDIVQNVGAESVMLYNGSGGPVTSGNVITGNVVRNFGAQGIILFDNAYADITNNDVLVPYGATGIQLQNFSNAIGSPSMTWSGNNITVGQDGDGIIVNLFYAPDATLNIDGNTINAASGVTATDSNGFTWGIAIYSVQSPATVSMGDNTIGDSGGQFQRGIDLWNVSTSNTVSISGGTIGDSDTGIELDNVDPLFGAATATSTVDVSGVDITGGTVGVMVDAQPLSNTNLLSGSNVVSGDVTMNVSGLSISGATTGIEVLTSDSGGYTAQGTIEDNTSITGATDGVLVSGSDASATIENNDGSIYGNTTGIDVNAGSATISGNHIYDNTTGIEFTASGGGTVTSNTFSGSTNNTVDLLIDTGAGAVVIGDGNQFAATNFYIEDLASENFDLTDDPNTVFGANPVLSDLSVPTDLSAFFGIEDKIVDYLDYPADGYVRLRDGYDFVTQVAEDDTSGAIQRGVNVANTDESSVPVDGDTVEVLAGTYTGDINIPESLTLLGAEAGVDPGASGWGASPQSTITGSGSVGPITIASGTNNVTIDGFTIQSPAGGSGSNSAAIWMNGSTGITIQDNTIQDNTAGVAIADAGGSITNDLIQDNNASGPSSGAGIEFFAGSSGTWTISDNHFTDNTNNDILSDPGSGATVSGLTISSNTMTASGGIALLSTIDATIEDNTIANSLYDAIGLLGGNTGLIINDNTITDPNGSGINVIGDLYSAAYPGFTAGGPDSVTISDDTITGATTAGITIASGNVTIQDSTLTGDKVGVTTTAFDYPGYGNYSGPINATLSGNTITGNSVAGIDASNLSNTFTSSTTQTNLMAQTNTLTGDGEGVIISGGAKVDLGYDSSDTTPGHANFTGLGSSTGHNILTGYADATGGYAIDDENTVSGSQPDVMAEDNDFGPYPAGDPGAIGNVIYDHADNAAKTTVFYIPALNSETAPTTVYVNAAWAGTADGTDADGPSGGALGNGTSFGYDEFADIQSAVNAVASGGNVDIYNGTYDQAVVVSNPMTITGQSTAGVVVQPASGGGSSQIAFTVGSSSVTIQDLTVNGQTNTASPDTFDYGVYTNDSLTSAYDTVINNTVINDDSFENIYGVGVLLYTDNPAVSSTTGNQVSNSTFNEIGTAAALNGGGYAILFLQSSGSITDNTITKVGNGIGTNFATQWPTYAPTISITGNHLSSFVAMGYTNVGIYASGLALDSQINDNTIDTSGDDLADDGIILTYLSDVRGTQLQVEDNTFTTDDDDVALTISHRSFGVSSTYTPVLASGNTFTQTGSSGTGQDVAIQISDTDNQGDSNDNTQGFVTDNTITGYDTGIQVLDAKDFQVTASITGNTIDSAAGGTGIEISGAGASATIGGSGVGESNTIDGASGSTGILVTGTGASATILDNNTTIENNSIGVDVEDGATAAVDGNVFSGNGTDVQIGAGSSVTSLTSNAFSGTQFINNVGSGNIDATTDSYNVGAGDAQVSGNSLTLAEAYAVEDRITDAIDQSGLGFVRIQDGNVFVTPHSYLAPATDDTGAISRAATVAASGDTIQIEAGSYYDNISTPQALTSLTFKGAGQGSTTVYPSTSNPLGSGSGSLNGGSNVFLVQGSNVTIEDLTIDGDNPNLTSGTVVDGADIDARNGIITNYNLAGASFTGLDVNQTTVENIYLRGIYYTVDTASDGGTFSFTNNTVTNVQGDSSGESIAIFNFYGSGLVQGNTVSDASTAIASNWSQGTQFLDNTITDSGAGIHTDNSGGAGLLSAQTDEIAGNNVSAGTDGAYGIYVFAPYDTVSVHDNTISGQAVGLALFGSQGATAPDVTFANNSVDGTGISGATAAYVSTTLLGYGFADADATFTGNTFTNNSEGMYIETAAGSGAGIEPTVSISGGQIDGADTGIEVEGGTASVSGVNFGGTANTTDILADSTAGAVTLTSNDFYGTMFIDNESSSNIDATTDSFDVGASDALVLGNSVTVAEGYATEDRIIDAIDQSSSGFVRIQDGNVFVTPNSYNSPTTTTADIQRAVDAASDGDIIHIEGGAYTGEVDTDGKGLTLALGDPAQVTNNGNLTLNSGDTLDEEIDGLTAGSQYDQLIVTGTVSLGGATLDTSSSTIGAVPNGSSVEIIDNTGSNPVSGTFAGLANHATLMVNGQLFEIFYNGGDGNDVVLTRISSAPPPEVVYVNYQWAGDPVGSNADPGGSGTAYGYDQFSDIQSAVDAVASGGTVDIYDGTYAQSNITVDNPMTIQGYLGVDPDAATHVIVEPAAASVNQTAFLVQSSTVTIQDLTINGSNGAANFLSGVITNNVNLFDGGTYGGYGAGDAAPSDAVYNNLTVENVTIENLTTTDPDDYFPTGIGILTQGTGNQILDNTLANITSSESGGAFAILSNGASGVIEGNTITNTDDSSGNPDTAIGANALDSSDDATTYAPQLTIQGNTINDTNIGMNLASLAGGSIVGGVTASDGNTINTTGTGSYGIIVDYAAGAVTIQNNTLTASGDGMGIVLFEDGTEPIQIGDNSLTSSSSAPDADGEAAGILVTDDAALLGEPSPAATTNVDIVGNDIDGFDAGVELQSSAGQNISATVEGGTAISGGDTGIQVSGSGASLAFSGSSAASLSDLSGNYITLADDAMGDGSTPDVVDASNVTFDGLGGGNATSLAQYYNIEDHITDYLDNASLGYVSLNATNVYVARSSELTADGGSADSIQRGVNVAPSGGDVNVQAGTYIGEIDIETPMSLLGAQAGVDPNSTPPSAADQTIIEPDTDDANPDDANAVTMLYIGTGTVTIDGLTLDGNNPNLSSGSTPDAATAIAAYGEAANVTVQNNIIENTGYAGIDLDDYNNGGTSTPTTNNLITDNLIQDLSDAYGYGIGINLGYNFYANVNNNVMQSVTVGVQTGNFYLANPGADSTATISGNQISASGVGIFYNLMYDAASAFTVSGNSITAIYSSADAPWQGILITSIQSGVNATFTDNTINGSAAYESASDPTSGYEVWNTPTTGTVLISGGTVSGVDYGVWVNSYEGYQSPADATSATISGVNITANKIGVYVEDSYPQYESEFEATDPPSPEVPVSATIEGDTSISTGGSGTGIEVSGPDASATISGNDASIDGNNVGILVSGGSATISDNHIYDNTTGIEFTAGGSGSVADNNFAGSTDNTADLEIASTAGTVSIGDSNAFAGGYSIENLSSQSFDLSGYSATTFGGVNLVGATLDQLFAIQNTIVDAIDVEGYGLVRLEAGNVYMTTESFYTPGGTSSASVQRAVDAASAGDTVNIANGTYTGQVQITKDLTLLGQSEAGAVLEAGANMAAAFEDNGGNSPVVYIGNNAIGNIQTLTVNGDAQGSTNYIFEGIAYFDASGTVNDVTVEHVHDSTLDGAQSGIGIFADSDNNSVQTLTVTNDEITDYQKNGMQLAGPGLTVDIDDDTITGAGSTNVNAQNGIVLGYSPQYSGGGKGEILDSTISGDTYQATEASDYDDAGVLLYGSSGNVTISGNGISDSDVGVDAYSTGGTVTVSDNTITDADGAGISGDGGTFVIEGNSVTGGVAAGYGNTADGIDLYDNVSGSTIHNNLLDDDGGTGVYIDSSVTDSSAPLTVNDNAFAAADGSDGDGTAGLDNASSIAVDATQNWWGSASGPTNATYNPDGTGVKLIETDDPTVTISPWLTSGTNNPPAPPGFYPSAGLTIDINGASSVDEGATYTLYLNPSNPNDPDVTSWMINWGDGSAVQDVTGDPTDVTHVYAEGNNNDSIVHTISATADTTDGTATSNDVNVEVTDAPISVSDVGLTTTRADTFDGQVATLTDDAGSDSNPSDLSATINWGDGSPATNATLVETSPTSGIYEVEGSHIYANYGNFTITVDASDDGGSSNSNTGNATVNDAGLALSLTSPSGVEEGVSTTMNLGTLTDASGTYSNQSDLSVTIQWGDSSSSAGTLVATATPGVYDIEGTHTYANDQTYTISVSAADNNGSTPPPAGSTAGPDTTSVAVGYNPPTVDVTGSATTVPSDSTYTLEIHAVTDPGPNDILGYIINWGDGSQISDTHGGSPANQDFTHSFDVPTTEPISVTIIDPDGSHTAELYASDTDIGQTLNVNVTDVPPTATPQNYEPTINVGEEGDVALTDAQSVSTYETNKGFTYYFDFNDNSGDTAGTYVSNGSTDEAYPSFSTPGTKYVGMRVEDFSGGYTDYVVSITVNDVAPTVNLPSSASANQNQTFTQAGSFTYPGNNPPYTAQVDYNFGGVGDPGFTPLALNANGSFTLSNTYNATGNYTVEVKVADGSGTTGTGTMTVNVSATNFEVTSFTQTSSGFDVTFNRAANLDVLNLYAGPTNEYGAPDLTLVGQNSGQIEGSLVWDPTTDTAHFIATEGVLAADSYTVTLVSGSSAWEDTNGNLLAGNGGATPGTNYVNTFTVSGSAGDVVSLPSFARGPGQAVDSPYTSSSGLPVSISNGSNVTAVDFNLDYNPALLSISNVVLASDLPAGWSVNFTNNAVSGVLSVSVFGTTALSSGPQTLVDLVTTVPTSATYGAAGMLKITNLTVGSNSGNIASTGVESVELAAFLGNTDGITGVANLNPPPSTVLDVYDPQDAYLIDYVVVQHLASNKNAGFDAYPLTDPLIDGDANEDGLLSGQDASLVAQEAIGETNVLPPIPAGFTPSTTPPPAGTDPNITVAADVLGNPGGTVVVPISIDTGAGLTAADFTLSFDSTKLTLTGATLGTVDASGFSVMIYGDEVEVFSDGSAQGSGSGAIMDLDFSIAANAAAGVTPVDITQGDLNGSGETLSSVTNGSVNIEVPSVSNEYLFYYGSSAFDGGATSPSSADTSAIATDKSALIPTSGGTTATYANVSNYTDGINGILVEFGNLGSGSTPNVNDFQFQVGTNGSSWSTAPTPSGFATWVDGSGNTWADIVWANDAIKNEWLQVTVVADSDTNLASNFVFYYGNLIAATGNSINNGVLEVNTTDVSETQQNETGFTSAPITDVYDFDRNGSVNTTDVSIAQQNETGFGGLPFITVTSAPSVVLASGASNGSGASSSGGAATTTIGSSSSSSNTTTSTPPASSSSSTGSSTTGSSSSSSAPASSSPPVSGSSSSGTVATTGTTSSSSGTTTSSPPASSSSSSTTASGGTSTTSNKGSTKSTTTKTSKSSSSSSSAKTASTSTTSTTSGKTTATGSTASTSKSTQTSTKATTATATVAPAAATTSQTADTLFSSTTPITADWMPSNTVLQTSAPAMSQSTTTSKKKK